MRVKAQSSIEVTESAHTERSARIRSIARRIENNHYPIDVRRLAEAILGVRLPPHVPVISV